MCFAGCMKVKGPRGETPDGGFYNLDRHPTDSRQENGELGPAGSLGETGSRLVLSESVGRNPALPSAPWDWAEHLVMPRSTSALQKLGHNGFVLFYVTRLVATCYTPVENRHGLCQEILGALRLKVFLNAGPCITGIIYPFWQECNSTDIVLGYRSRWMNVALLRVNRSHGTGCFKSFFQTVVVSSEILHCICFLCLVIRTLENN